MDVQGNVGIKLTESDAMWPSVLVSGAYFSHPEARYMGFFAP
jgi:5-methyltetrahydrofolate--homocysteine methyltransferase